MNLQKCYLLGIYNHDYHEEIIISLICWKNMNPSACYVVSQKIKYSMENSLLEMEMHAAIAIH